MNKYFKQILRHKKRHLFGQPLQQSFASIFVIEQFLYYEKPDLIIELGTGNGILSHYFAVYSKINQSSFHTFDIKKPEINLEVFVKMDVYLVNVMNKITRIIDDYKKPFLFVDVLDPKSDLLNMYAPELKSGTFVFAHDFVTNADKKAHWCFTEDAIDFHYIDKLEPYYTMAKELDTRGFFGIIK